ncbi:hypothetical protein Rruber_05179 (plasmid) [Rhodococcus ruber]|uniref:cupin domain-containing protein n=1 Tax=Rhodococcus ruber TaxID=1830 RepID=UPI00315D12CA
MTSVFPEIVQQLPGCAPVEGVQIHISHTDTHEVMFLQCDIDLTYPSHAHSAQWTVVLSGEIEVTIFGETTTYRKGDTYYIPANVEHTVKMSAGYSEVFLVDEPNVLGL